MAVALQKLSISGFKSIERLEDFSLASPSILIGANGAGKSNFVDFFRLLRAMVDEQLQAFVARQLGSGDGFFYLGPKHTAAIGARLEFGSNVYQFSLGPTADGSLYIVDEAVQFTGGYGIGQLRSIGSGLKESTLRAKRSEPARFGSGMGVPGHVYDSVAQWVVYHFHDTSALAPMRREQLVQDSAYLRNDAGNIAAFLLNLRETGASSYTLVVDSVRSVMPFLDDFLLRVEERGGEQRVRLDWRQKGSDFPFQPNHLSDGTLRFICLATALQQPSPPSLIVIDEPELGLHPYAIALLAELIHAAAKRTQVIVSTQSPQLIDHFAPHEIVVVNREDGRSVFRRLDEGTLADWLEEYTLGELWQKNVVQAGPTYE